MGIENETRADWAETALFAATKALAAFRDKAGHGGETDIPDLIANLCHLAERQGINPKHAIEDGYGMFAAESEAEEEEGPGAEPMCNEPCFLVTGPFAVKLIKETPR